jgi:CRP-like cAMP-binding protein
MSAPSNWPRNRLLLALPSRNLKQVLPELEYIRCEREQILVDADSLLDHVFFPDSGVVSVMAVYSEGGTIEMATIGREGCTGVQAVFGAKSSSARFFVQIPGSAAKMPRPAFTRAMGSMSPFRSLMYAYVQAFFEQVMVSVACNGAHSLKQRLARWLLMMRDRSDEDELPDHPEPSRRNVGCPKAKHHECRARAGTRRLDRARPAASHDTRSASPRAGVLRMLSAGPGAGCYSPPQDIRINHPTQCYPVAIEGKADIFCSLRAVPLMTQPRHGRLKIFAAQKHCSFLRWVRRRGFSTLFGGAAAALPGPDRLRACRGYAPRWGR